MLDRRVLISDIALKAQALSRSRNGGKYHIKNNNCQHFILELQRRVTAVPDAHDTSTESDNEGHRMVEYNKAALPLTSFLYRWDSVTSKSEMRLEIPQSTFAPLRLSTVAVHTSRKGDITRESVVSVVRTSVSAQI